MGIKNQTESAKAYKPIERRVKERLAELWKCQMVEFGDKADIDWLMVRNDKVIALVEFKKREISSTKYSNTILCKRKVEASELIKEHFQIPCYAVIYFEVDRKCCFLNILDYDWIDDVTRTDRGITNEHAHYKMEGVRWLQTL